MKKRKGIQNVFGIVLIVVVVIVFIILINGRQDQINNDKGEVQKICTMDLSTNYPKSPREVVTLYSRIVKCLYNEEYTDDEFKLIVDHMRALFDEQLLELNPYNTHIENIRMDVSSYKNKGKIMTSYNVDKADKVEYVTIKDGSFCAKINATFTFKSDEEGKTKTSQQFVLKRDTDGNWKIVYWIWSNQKK